jgi:hypothetical protein
VDFRDPSLPPSARLVHGNRWQMYWGGWISVGAGVLILLVTLLSAPTREVRPHDCETTSSVLQTSTGQTMVATGC